MTEEQAEVEIKHSGKYKERISSMEHAKIDGS